ncbi:sugar nucleotide-binding protein [Microbacterium sp. YJN-G]|uniref:sugar nucleotide-binding protein n=1 Tax=Microbacterium sp. YJN-G TaxID=2763257 RepID=UPI001D0C8DDB|nr:sugar nucleotide-binding protein [Microbacterium sp. YJN-G]
MSTPHDRSRDRRVPGRTLLVGCGRLGMGLGQRLLADGSEVIAIRRSAAALPAGFTAITDDLRVAGTRELPACDSVVITLPPDAESRDGRDIYTAALTHLAAALPARPERVVFVSSTRVFEGRAGDAALSETDAPAPVSPRACALLAGEELAVGLFGASIVRPAGIYGPGRGSLIRRVREHTPVDHSRRTNRIHETDLIGALHAVLRAGSAPALLHAVDQRPARLGEVVTFIADRLGVDPPPRAVPESGGGTVLEGRLLLEFAGSLRYPTFREGYEEVLAART